jgi:hypothetical protein
VAECTLCLCLLVDLEKLQTIEIFGNILDYSYCIFTRPKLKPVGVFDSELERIKSRPVAVNVTVCWTI